MAEQEQQEEEREAARRAEERSAQLDQMRSEQQGQQHDEPAPDLSDIQPHRDSGSGMELSRQLGGAPRETEQWKVDGMKLAADLQAGGMKPYQNDNEAPRSLADEPAPDLSDIDQKIADAEQQVQQRDTKFERQQEQER